MAAEFKNIAFCALAYSDDMVGLTQCLAELPLVDLRIYPVVVFGMPHKNQVVDGDNAFDATLTDVNRQFAGKSVI